MIRSFRAPLMLALAGLLFAANATFAQQAPSRVPTVTRLVKIFAELETGLDEAIVHADTAAVDKLVAEDFEMRAGNAPGTPIPRDAAMEAVQREGLHRFEQIAVHDYGTVAVVSFAQRPVRNGGAPVFVIDVWRRASSESSPDAWKLATRYAGSSAPIGLDGKLNTVPKKY